MTEGDTDMANNNKWRPVTQGPAAEQSQAAQVVQGVNDTPSQGINPSPNGDPPAPALTDGQPTANPSATGQESAPTTDLAALVANLSPEQLARVRELAASKGIAQSISPRKGPNGGIMLEIEVPAEVIEPFQTWSQEAGEPFAEFVNKIAGMSLINYCFQDWGAIATAPAAASATGA